MSDKLYSLIANIMNIPIEQINDQSGPESIPSWTSFSGYVLLSELESKFNTKFSIDEVVSVKTVADIKKHLRNHGVTL